MSDVKASLFSRITHLLSAEFRVAEKRADLGRRDDDGPAVQDAERRLFEREESFYWNWQYPGRW
jgi:hypothetical protein